MNRGMSDAGELAEVLVCGPNPNGEEVHVVSGGWISGPAIDPDDVPLRQYGLNIVAIMSDYSDFVIMGKPRSTGWLAYVKGKRSRAVGSPIEAPSLDGLALEMNRVRRRMDGV